MQDQPKQPRSISEISHLFLSSVREKQTGGAARPVRTPPPSQPELAAHEADLTPEEYAHVFEAPEHGAESHADLRIPPVTAVISQHLNGSAHERIREYARHLAANGERVGLLEVDVSEVRLMCFERSIEPNSGDPDAAPVTEHFDARQLTESLDEMSWDLDRWLLVLPNLRSPESRALLKDVDHWTLLSTCDHDGIVSSYRTLKGLANVHRPRMTLAVLEAATEMQATKVHRKLANVCLQFLGLELQAEQPIRPTQAVAEHLVAHCRPTRDKAQLGGGAQWLVVTNFLAKAKAQAAKEKSETRIPKSETNPNPHIANPQTAAVAPAEDPRFTVRNPAPQPAPQIAPPNPQAEIRNPQFTQTPATPNVSEVLDLPNTPSDPDAVLSAILSGTHGELLECPVRAPACPAARLAVTRDRTLTLLAVADKGLKDLRNIAQAYRWLAENRALIGMAMPQLAIDAHAHPRLTLFIDHADATADALSPMLQAPNVSVRAYRKLRWGAKTGLLLDAA